LGDALVVRGVRLVDDGVQLGDETGGVFRGGDYAHTERHGAEVVVQGIHLRADSLAVVRLGSLAALRALVGEGLVTGVRQVQFVHVFRQAEGGDVDGVFLLREVEHHTRHRHRFLLVGQLVEALVGFQHEPQGLGGCGLRGEREGLTDIHRVDDVLAQHVTLLVQFRQFGSLGGGIRAGHEVVQLAEQDGVAVQVFVRHAHRLGSRVGGEVQRAVGEVGIFGIVQLMEAEGLDFYDFFHIRICLMGLLLAVDSFPVRETAPDGPIMLSHCGRPFPCLRKWFPDVGERFPRSEGGFPRREKGK